MLPAWMFFVCLNTGGININSTTKNDVSQEDKTLKSELENKWTPKKKWSRMLSECYKRLHKYKKAKSVSECANFLEFRKPVEVCAPVLDAVASKRGATSDGWKLSLAFFCRDRLCPSCQWRRTLKVFSQVSRIMNTIEHDFNFVFLTLTVPNCTGEELPNVLDELSKAWFRFSHYKRFQNAVDGYFKSLEVTYNKITGLYHPHLHTVLAVGLDYYTSDKYINQSEPFFEWTKMWQKALKTTDTRIVHVEKIGATEKKTVGGAVAEASKYSVKTTDYIKISDTKKRDKVVSDLNNALTGRRLCSFGGIFEDVRKALQLDDYDDGDLIHVDGTEIRPDVDYMIRTYKWGCGAYELIEERTDVNLDLEVEYDEM